MNHAASLLDNKKVVSGVSLVDQPFPGRDCQAENTVQDGTDRVAGDGPQQLSAYKKLIIGRQGVGGFSPRLGVRDRLFLIRRMEVQTQVEETLFMNHRGTPDDPALKGAPIFVPVGIGFQADRGPRLQGGIGLDQEPVPAFIEEINKMRAPVRRSRGRGIAEGTIKSAYSRDRPSFPDRTAAFQLRIHSCSSCSRGVRVDA
jgi:hypothetical protein